MDSSAAEVIADTAEKISGHRQHSRRRCMRGVRVALQRSEVVDWDYQLPRARDAVAVLKQDNQFVQVVGSAEDGRLTAAELQQIERIRGAIVVYENPFRPRKAGHICITTGDGGAISDFRQPEIDVYKPHGGKVDGYYVFLPVDRSQKVTS